MSARGREIRYLKNCTVFLAEILATPRFSGALFSMVMFILQNSHIDSAVHWVFNTRTTESSIKIMKGHKILKNYTKF